jgi:hypothetical protein
MGISSSVIVLCALFAVLVSSSPEIRLNSRDALQPIVDLGYAKYQGSTDPSTNISTFLSIRYAIPPIGEPMVAPTTFLN